MRPASRLTTGSRSEAVQQVADRRDDELIGEGLVRQEQPVVAGTLTPARHVISTSWLFVLDDGITCPALQGDAKEPPMCSGAPHSIRLEVHAWPAESPKLEPCRCRSRPSVSRRGGCRLGRC